MMPSFPLRTMSEPAGTLNPLREGRDSLFLRELHGPRPPTPCPPSMGQPSAPNPPSHLLWCVGSPGARLPPHPAGKLGLWLLPAL